MEQLGAETKQKVEGINVLVRLRPPGSYGEEKDGNSQVVKVSQGGRCVSLCNVDQPTKAVSCVFDRAFGPDSTQQEVFRGLLPSLDTILQGFNVCVLAYGQTGSGKTHTLIGPGGGTRLAENSSDWGIIPRAVQFLFDRLLATSAEDETFTFSVTCSFMQIYNENLVDLLQNGVERRGPSLQIREESAGAVEGGTRGRRRRRTYGAIEGGSDTEGEAIRSGRRRHMRPIGLHENRRVFVSGLSSFRVSGAEDVLRYVSLGAANRNVRATQHNEASSRSHAVMQLIVDSESSSGGGRVKVGTDNGNVTYRQAKLSIVDLAGSEKMDNTVTTSRGHFRELRCINQSLSALGNVVSALSEKGRKHVPYRDSKLTRLLQDSLGGNTRTTIIACVNPLAAHTNETISTLMFADRAKKVMVRIRPNEVTDDRVLLARAQAEIARLKQLLRQALENALRTDGPSFSPTGSKPGIPSRDGAERTAGVEEEATVAVETNVRSPAEIGTISTDVMDYPAGNGRAQSTKPNMHNRQIIHLIAENERLREDKNRLLADVQRLMQMAKKTKQRRRGGRSVTPVRGVAPLLPIAPFDWGTRYAHATAQARRRKSSSSQGRCSSPRDLSPPTRPALPVFKWRGLENNYEDEGDPLENDLSVSEIGDVIDDNYATTSSGSPEEAEKVAQLKAFRSSLKEADDWSESEGECNGGASWRGGMVDIQSFVEESQRLEELMSEAYGRERRLLREERARLASSRTERIALEARLDELTSGVMRAPVATTMPEIDNANARIPMTAGTSTAAASVHQAVLGGHELTSPGAALPTMHTNILNSGAQEGNRDKAGAWWIRKTTAAPQITTINASPAGRDCYSDNICGDGTEHPAARSGLGPENTIPPTHLPGRQRKTSWTAPNRFRRTQRGQRPATSAVTASRAQLRRPRRWRSRSPIKYRPLVLPTATAQQREKRSQKVARLSAPSAAKLKAMQVTYPSSSLLSHAGEKRLLSRETERRLADGTENGEATAKRKLAFSAADLGLRLKIYSFRYDHHYECQVIGYDPRRRMHRCAYDATGEKQWHDLANKRFEVIAQNGVIIRSSESAP